MTPHYNCSYRMVPNEVRVCYSRRYGCPWPHMVLHRVFHTKYGPMSEALFIGLN